TEGADGKCICGRRTRRVQTESLDGRCTRKAWLGKRARAALAQPVIGVEARACRREHNGIRISWIFGSFRKKDFLDLRGISRIFGPKATRGTRERAHRLTLSFHFPLLHFASRFRYNDTVSAATEWGGRSMVTVPSTLGVSLQSLGTTRS